jgi:hypothetical protein
MEKDELKQEIIEMVEKIDNEEWIVFIHTLLKGLSA